MTTHLLLAHGSPDPRHARSVFDLAARVTRRGGQVEAAFLDHDEPRAHDWVAARPGGRVVTLGLFINRGHHVQVDVPRVLAGAPPGVEVVDRGTLGAGSWLQPVVADLVATAGGDDGTHVVLVTAGAAARAARRPVEEFGRQWSTQRSGRVSVIHSAEDIASRASEGTVVVPLLVSPGVLVDRVHRASRVAGVAATPPLGGSLTFADAVALRLGLTERHDPRERAEVLLAITPGEQLGGEQLRQG